MSSQICLAMDRDIFLKESESTTCTVIKLTENVK